MGFDIRVSGIVEESIVDGPGLRYTVFTQGCPHHCPGCHNPQTHDFAGGSLMSVEEILESFDENPLLAGMTLSGGEPFVQAGALCELAKGVKERNKNVVIFSGYTLEQLRHMAELDSDVEQLLCYCDLLIDGPFEEDKKDLELLFRGSANQKLWDLTEYPLVKDVTAQLEESVKTYMGPEYE